jgi:hypothetical protein
MGLISAKADVVPSEPAGRPSLGLVAMVRRQLLQRSAFGPASSDWRVCHSAVRAVQIPTLRIGGVLPQEQQLLLLQTAAPST